MDLQIILVPSLTRTFMVIKHHSCLYSKNLYGQHVATLNGIVFPCISIPNAVDL